MSLQTKKIKQDELRRLMVEQKKKLLSNVKKIESPLARYDKDGSLHCIICQTIVKSEKVWSIHLNSKKHKENVTNKIKKKEQFLEPMDTTKTNPLKRQAPPLPVCTKKIKSILKNPQSTNHIESIDSEESIPENQSETPEMEYDNIDDSDSEFSEKPDDNERKDVLPEGFFDDPKLDAKVRNVEYKDPVEEEWEQFQKEIREETSKAQQIIAEDQEEATTERQIDEIDEQIRNWKRVLSLEKKKEEVFKPLTVKASSVKEEESSGEEYDFDEFLDWRSKKSFN